MAAVGYRLAAVRAYIKRSANEVASFFGTKPETVIRWASNFHRYGIQGLENKNRGHRRMKLTAEIQDEVRKWLEDDTDHAGHPVHWTLRRLCLEIKSVFSVEISIAAMGSTLKKTGMAQKRPRPIHYNSSKEVREEFKKNLPSMIEEIKPDGFMGQIEFVFQDESRFGTITTLGRSWKPVGEEFEVRMKLGRENLYLFGAVTPSTGELFTQIYEKSNTESMNDFIRKFAASKPDRFIVMIMDRAKWLTTKKLKTPKNIALIFLPPVSPQLNPIERLWKIIKADFFHNRLHDSIEDVQSGIMRALTSLTPKKIASICKCSYLNAC